jgi:hypothetical protein
METLVNQRIESRIFTVRGMQVMLDSDLAELYQVETKVLNQAVKRNLDRFPESFRLKLTVEEYASLRSQFVTSNTDHGGRRYQPYAFTEQGVAMLSAVLRSDAAVQVSIQIMQAFVKMRFYLFHSTSIFQRLDRVELNQLKTDAKVDKLFQALEAGHPKPDKGIFFDGQVFDAWVFVVDLVKSAQNELILIDNYIDESVLVLLSKRNPEARATIYTKSISKQLQLDLKKHNSQYPPIVIKQLKASHDRFMIIDRKELYHIGASLKDLGKKWFAFSKMDHLADLLLKHL